MLKTNSLFSLVAGLVLGGAAFASGTGGEECTKAKTVAAECSAAECPTAQKVTSLLTRWEAAAEETKSATPEARAQFAAKVQGVAEKCPVGSRLGETFAAVRDTLGLLVASQEASAENCPLEKTEAGSFAEAKRMKAYRAEALNGLHRLASYAAGSGCSEAAAACAEKTAASCADVADACCASEASAVAKSDAKADCEEGAADCGTLMASRLETLKASFVEARRQAESMSPEARHEILSGFASLGEESAVVALVPETLGVLAEGFEALNGLHAKMGEWAQANPELLGDLPESAHAAFRSEVSLVQQAASLLESATGAMQAMQSTATKTAMAR